MEGNNNGGKSRSMKKYLYLVTFVICTTVLILYIWNVTNYNLTTRKQLNLVNRNNLVLLKKNSLMIKKVKGHFKEKQRALESLRKATAKASTLKQNLYTCEAKTARIPSIEKERDQYRDQLDTCKQTLTNNKEKSQNYDKRIESLYTSIKKIVNTADLQKLYDSDATNFIFPPNEPRPELPKTNDQAVKAATNITGTNNKNSIPALKIHGYKNADTKNVRGKQAPDQEQPRFIDQVNRDISGVAKFQRQGDGHPQIQKSPNKDVRHIKGLDVDGLYGNPGKSDLKQPLNVESQMMVNKVPKVPSINNKEIESARVKRTQDGSV